MSPTISPGTLTFLSAPRHHNYIVIHKRSVPLHTSVYLENNPNQSKVFDFYSEYRITRVTGGRHFVLRYSRISKIRLHFICSLVSSQHNILSVILNRRVNSNTWFDESECNINATLHTALPAFFFRISQLIELRHGKTLSYRILYSSYLVNVSIE